MMQSSLARKLRVLRAERGLTQRAASAQIGVTKETLSDLERGLRHPHDVTLSRIARGYGVPVDELLEEPAPLAGKAKAPDTGQPQPSTGTVAEFVQKLERVLAPARAEALREERALNRFFASEGIERDYSGPIAEEEVSERFLDEFSPEERPGAFSAVLLGYARLEHARANLEANFTRLQKMLREGREQTAQLEEKIGQLEEKIAKMEKRLRERNEQVHAPSRAEAERQGVRD
jgi:transcriptional regulator with XRE-family HTH domain